MKIDKKREPRRFHRRP